MTVDLALVWAGLLAFAVLAYIVLDGFDLGVGLLFPFLSDDTQRDVAMNSVAPVWDGNETWLVLGGGGRGVPAGLRHIAAGSVRPDHRDAPRARVSGGLVRVPSP